MYHIYNGNILILVGGVYKCSKLKMLGFNVVPSATWDLDSRRHGTLTQSMALRVEVQAAANQDIMWNQASKPLGKKLETKFV